MQHTFDAILSSPRRRAHLVKSGLATRCRLAAAALEAGVTSVFFARSRDEYHQARGLLTLCIPELSCGAPAVETPRWRSPVVSLPPDMGQGVGGGGNMGVSGGGRAGNAGWGERVAALYALRSAGAHCVVLTPASLLLRYMPLTFFDEHEITLQTGSELDVETLLEQCVLWGFDRQPTVTRPGDMARRGDIFDIWAPGYERPARVEFFGDMIEEIRFFDASSQRSLCSVREMTLLPMLPVAMGTLWRTKALERWERLFQKGLLGENPLHDMRKALDRGGAGLLPGVYYEAPTVLEEWLPKDALWLLPGEADTKEDTASAAWALGEFLESSEAAVMQPARYALRPAESVESLWVDGHVVFADPLVMGVPTGVAEGLTAGRGAADAAAGAGDVAAPADACDMAAVDAAAPVGQTAAQAAGHASGQTSCQAGRHVQDVFFALPERRLHAFTDLFPTAAAQDRPWQHLAQGLKEWQSSRRQTILCFASERGRTKFLGLAGQEGITPLLRYAPQEKGLFALVASFRGGVDLGWDKGLILGEDILYPKAEKNRRVASGAFRGLERLDDVDAGQLLVHREYGIGRFMGLQRMDVGGVGNDFLLLEYSGGARLYVPADRLSQVQRFKGGDGDAPPLDRLGSPAWAAGKEKARKAIEKIAADLVEMYAFRKIAKGYRYGDAGELYREFEATFGFEETPDQAKAIQDVLDDMDKPEPMDRLVCGDVGFGKTEVALRAAFRAAADGRQVALLCPTTVLAEQHYQTFRARLAGFPLNVGLLSRFVSKNKQKEVLQAAAQGQIDIVVGTHRLLSADVKLPNLGLLILDEEQRFGVRHKEKIKALKKNVDVLTLTATPIPRTLQLSMSGIRELSIIETAPPERKPVATALVPRDPAMLKDVLQRELAREGQVFWVYNRVQGLERVAEQVRSLVPSARVGMAHGQMAEGALEETMRRFWHGELDVLVCTSIVESGLDFPRANTLIVDQAQMFGLGQLYQLRGRVGRSDRQAYAVFVTPQEERLSDLARERLRIILELDYLGAGFQVAMEDLRLRGAGNILGEVQSGHMTRVGLDLYLEMLEEAVARLKGCPAAVSTETELNLGLAAHIPESYINDGRERLRCYKMLTAAASNAAREDVALGIRDRYGAFPPELENFLSVLAFKQTATLLAVQKADIYGDRIRLHWAADQKTLDVARLVALVDAVKGARMLPPATLELPLHDVVAASGQGAAAQAMAFGRTLAEMGQQLLSLRSDIHEADRQEVDTHEAKTQKTDTQETEQ